MAGFIKIYRDILEWEWYKDIPVRILFEHCLLKANHTANRWQGILIEAGQFITSLDKLAFETGLTKMQVRRAIKKLNLTQEITHEGHRSYSIITVNNWGLYQQNSTADNTQITREEHADNTRRTPNKNDKNDKNEKNSRERVCARAREDNNEHITDNDPYLSENVQKFIKSWRSEVDKPCRLSPDERLKLWRIINDLLMQGLTIDEICSAACGNFLKIDSRNNFGINWLLKDDNFYSILNGEWQKKELPKDAADTGGKIKTKTSQDAVVEFLKNRGVKPK